MLNTEKIKKDFPIFKRKINGKNLIYFDNSATSQRPKQVIDAINNFYKNTNANVNRGVYKLSEDATEAYNLAREKIANFINARFDEIVFTKSTTESLNLLSYSLGEKLENGDEVILTQMEHHSNIVPWQQLAKRRGVKLKYVKINKEGLIEEGEFKKAFTKKTKLVSMTHISNVLGTINPVKKFAKIAHDHKALFILDAAQSAPHIKLDVRDLGCDFLAFSGHKMLGPFGIGVLYGKKELLESMEPFLFGGDMIKEVDFYESKWNELPWKFEAGTQNIAGILGLAAAVDYLNKMGLKKIHSHEKELVDYAYTKIKSIPEVTIYGPKNNRASLISFNVGKLHSHDVASFLDMYGIAIRGGHHCAMPLAKQLKIVGSARVSFYFYNNKQEVDKFCEALKKCSEAME